MKSFIEVLGNNEQTTAQEVALTHTMELQTEIAAIEAALPSIRQQAIMYTKKQLVEATSKFESALGNLKTPSTEKIIEQFVVLQAVENGENNPFTEKLQQSEARLKVLKEVLALFPKDVNEIKVKESK